MAVADLIYSIAGDSSKFIKALQAADKQLEKSIQGMSAMGKAGAYVTAGLGAAATAMGELSRQALNDMVAIQRAADRVGMSAEQMSKLEYAAKLSGIQFDELSDAVAEFNLKIGEAATGDQASIDAFKQLGVAITDMNGAVRPSGKILEDVIDALAQVPDKSSQAALAAKVLGEEAGIKLGPLLAQGSGALKKMGDEAQRLGLVFDDKAGASADALQKNITRLQGVADGLGRHIVQVFAPAFVSLSDKMVDSAQKTDQLANRQDAAMKSMKALAVLVRTLGFAFEYSASFASRFLSGLVIEAQTAAKVIANIPGVLSEAMQGVAGDAMRRTAEAIEASAAFNRTAEADRLEMIRRYREDVAELTGATLADAQEQGKAAEAALVTPWDNFLDQRKKFNEQNKALGIEFDSLESREEAKEAGKRTGKSFADGMAQGMNSAAKRMADEAARIIQSMQDAAKRIFDETRTTAERTALELAEVEELWRAGLIDDDTANRATRAIESERDQELNDRLAEARQQAEDAAKAIQDEGEQVKLSTRTSLEQIQAEYARLGELQKAGAIDAQTYARAVQALGGEEFVTSAQRTQAEIDRLNELLRIGAIDAAGYDAALNKLFPSAEKSLSMMDKLGATAATSLADNFQKFLFDPFNTSLGDMVKNFMGAIAQMVTEVIAKQAVLALFGGASASPSIKAALGFAEGGYVAGPGTGTSDSIPARLSNGEYVMPANTVRHFGVDFMDAIRAMRPAREAPVARFAEGGYVQQQSGTSGGGVRVVNVVDSSMVQDFLTSSAGEQVILNTIRRNRRQVSQVMG